MKKFVSENWYKLMIGSSLLMASFGFMVHSVSPAKASILSNSSANSLLTPGEVFTSGCGISAGYVYLVDFKVNGNNHYYKIPLDRFKTSNDFGE